MKLAVFGATGQTGSHVVQIAIERGHEVAAMVRNPSKVALDHSHLRIVTGDADDETAIEAVLGGAEAVLSTMGSGNGTLQRFSANLLPSMERQGVSRVVSLVGAGVRDPADRRSLGRTFMLGLMRIVAGHVLQDAEAHAEALRGSGLDWTLIRPPRLTNGPVTGHVRSAPSLVLGPRHSISRADLAAFMIGVVESGQYINQAPMVVAD